MTGEGSVAAVDAPRVGADLRAARERLGWRLPDVARDLRIRLPYLAALEEGRIGDLPGNAYALGFLRSYAGALGLDPEELSRRFKAEAATVSRKTELAFPAPLPERGMPTGAVLLLGLVLVVGAYVGWYRLSGEGRLPAETVPPVPQRLAPLIASVPPPAPTVPQSGAPAAGTAAGGAAPGAGAGGAAPAAGNAAAASAAPAAADISPASAAAATTAASGAPPPGTPAATPPGQAAVAAPSAAAPPAGQSAVTPPAGAASPPAAPSARVVVAANADAWMEVRDASGQILLNRVLHAGETWPVPAGTGLRLTTGNAGGTYLIVDGTAEPPLGRPGAVRRGLTLNPDRIKAGALVVPAPGTTPMPAPAPMPMPTPAPASPAPPTHAPLTYAPGATQAPPQGATAR